MGKGLAGAVAFVSAGVGGATGIDRELARRLAGEGATVIVVAADVIEAADAGQWATQWATQRAGESATETPGVGRRAVYCAAGDAEADLDALVELAAELSR